MTLRILVPVSMGLAAALLSITRVQLPHSLEAAPPETARRIPWIGSRVVGSPDPAPPFKAVNAFPQIKLDRPLLIASAPGLDRLFIGEQTGRIYSFPNQSDAKADLFLDLRKDLKTLDRTPKAKEVEMVYGLAFHPKFAENGFCYVCYTVRAPGIANLPNGSRVSRFRVRGLDPPRADPASEEILLTFLQGGHNGGDLHFGPDGFLYLSTGDAESPNPPDPRRTGQDITDLLSSILRIDVDRKDPGLSYSIPRDNPFVGLQIGDGKARPEVWAYGFRNPWRMSFDRQTGDLWAGDVGWELWEMVHKIEKGGNYGWSIREGPQLVNTSLEPGPTPIRPATIEIPHTAGASVTGGYVYRGKKFPELVGTYIFGDWETRRIWSARINSPHPVPLTELVAPTVRVVAFGQDSQGELFFADHDRGTIHRLERNEATSHDPARFPKTLSTTGLFNSTRDHVPAPGVYRFEPIARQWQDFATSEHFIALPNTSSIIDHYEQKQPIPGNVDWHHFRYHFPKNAVLVKTISLERVHGAPATRRRIETQLLHFDGEDWRGFSYAWRDDQSDADLVPGEGSEKVISVRDPRIAGGQRQQIWTYHSRSQCLQCHNAWAEYTLGFTPEQLNDSRSSGGNRRNQLSEFGDLGLIERRDRSGKPRPALTEAELQKARRWASPKDLSRPLNERVKSYLHVNCGHCHRFGGGGAVDFELHGDADLNHAKLKDAKPVRGTFDIPDARLLATGEPGRSMLYYRTAKFGSGRMPHLGSELVDPAGTDLLARWITAARSDRKPDTMKSEELTPEAIDSALSSVATAEVISRMVAAGTASPATTSRILAAAEKLPAGNVRDLFEGYLNHAGKERTLGTAPRPRAILSFAGDATRGKKLFFTEKSRCLSCHKLEGQGTELGPDLSKIGAARPRDFLLESLLEPSRRIEGQYQAYLLRTHDGQVLTGLLVSKSGTEVILRDSQNKELRIEAPNVDSLSPSRESFMPTGLLAEFTAQQAADLLEYLSSRK